MANSDKDQWVELFNNSDNAVDISGWSIDDDGGSQKFTIPTGTILAPYQFIAFSSGLFNLNISSPDTLQLFHGENMEDSFHYSAPLAVNTSLGRKVDGDSEWVAFVSPSKGESNNGASFSVIPSDTPTSMPVPATVTFLPTMTKAPTVTKIPTPTKAPTSTKVPTPTKIPTPTKSGPISTRVPTQKQIQVIATLINPTIGEEKISSEAQDIFPTAVLGASTTSARSDEDNLQKRAQNMSKNVNVQKISFQTILAVVIGILFLSCAILFYLRNRKKLDIL